MREGAARWARQCYVEKKFERDTHRARLEWMRAKMFVNAQGNVTERKMAVDVSEELARKASVRIIAWSGCLDQARGRCIESWRRVFIVVASQELRLLEHLTASLRSGSFIDCRLYVQSGETFLHEKRDGLAQRALGGVRPMLTGAPTIPMGWTAI
jgi:hypothetical protein